MQITYDKIKRRLFITSENESESALLKDIGNDMKRHDAAVNITYSSGGDGQQRKTKLALTPPTARFVLAANQFYKEQTAK